jgi:hypothetical protein
VIIYVAAKLKSYLTNELKMRNKNFGRKSLLNLLRAMERLAGAEPNSQVEPPLLRPLRAPEQY